MVANAGDASEITDIVQRHWFPHNPQKPLNNPHNPHLFEIKSRSGHLSQCNTSLSTVIGALRMQHDNTLTSTGCVCTQRIWKRLPTTRMIRSSKFKQSTSDTKAAMRPFLCNWWTQNHLGQVRRHVQLPPQDGKGQNLQKHSAHTNCWWA